jgi:lipoate-protein ligase A
LHDAELTYAVVTPLGALGSVREGYLRINQAIAEALFGLGAPVDIAEDGKPLSPDAGPCFQTPAAGEIVAQGRKLVGSAQVRIGRGLLQHGSILLANDQEALARLAEGAPAERRPITLSRLIAHVRIDEVAAAVAKSLQIGLGGEWQEGAFDPSEEAAAARLEQERYGLDSWTWRR